MNILLAYALALVIVLTPVTANYHEETGLGVVEQIVVQQEPPSYRDRLEYQVSRGEIRAINMKITAYDLSYESCEKYPDDPAYGITASGEHIQEGFVAVDTDVIPMHTKMYVDGYGVVVAKDRGGAIQGNRMDIFMPDKKDALKWGVQNRKVYILGR